MKEKTQGSSKLFDSLNLFLHFRVH